MKEYKISEELINEVFKHLGSRPYVEVAKVIDGLQKGLKEIEEVEENTDEGDGMGDDGK